MYTIIVIVTNHSLISFIPTAVARTRSWPPFSISRSASQRSEATWRRSWVTDIQNITFQYWAIMGDSWKYEEYPLGAFMIVRSKPASSTIIPQWQDLFSGAELEGDLIIKEVENIEAKIWKVKTGNSTHILYITNQANKYHKLINPLGGKPACRSETPDFQVESLSLTYLTSATITVVAQQCATIALHCNLHDIKIRTLDCQAWVDQWGFDWLF